MEMGKYRKPLGTYFVSLLSITLVLLVVGLLMFILVNAKGLSDSIQKNIGFTVILKDNTRDVEVTRLQKVLESKPYVLSSDYVSKDEAARRYRDRLGEDFEEVLGYNPLLSSIELHLQPQYANGDSLAVIEKSLLTEESVFEVDYQKSLVHLVAKNVNKISLVLLIAAIVLILISFTLIRNTVHQYVYSRRFQIKTMQLVGAKSSFISGPYLSDGVLLGLFGGLLADLLILAVIFLLQREFGDVVRFFDIRIVVFVVVFVLVFGVLLSFFSALSSVRKYINKRVEDIYD